MDSLDSIPSSPRTSQGGYDRATEAAGAHSPRRRYPTLSVDVGPSAAGAASTRRVGGRIQAAGPVNTAREPADAGGPARAYTAPAAEATALSTGNVVPASPGRNSRAVLDHPLSQTSKPRSPARNRSRTQTDDPHSATHQPDQAHKGPMDRLHHTPLPKSGKAEVHIIGELVGCSGCSQKTAFCRWELDHDSERWHVLRGRAQGCTHTASPEAAEDPLTLWSHPIDIWMSTHSIQRWPSLVLRLYTQDDWSGHSSFCGYAVCPVPTTPGIHDICCRAWAALEVTETPAQRSWRWFARRVPRLMDESYVVDGHSRREGDNGLLYTVPAGTVHLRLQILTKDLGDLVHVGGESVLQSLEKLHTYTEKMKRRANTTIRAMNEHTSDISEGLRLVQQGREERFQAVQQALDARRAQDQHNPSTPTSRRSSFLNSTDRRSSSLLGTSPQETPRRLDAGPSPVAGVNRPRPRNDREDGAVTPRDSTASTPLAADTQSPSPTRRNYRERPAAASPARSPPANRTGTRARPSLDHLDG